MKKMRLLLPALLLMAVFAVSCGNSGSTTETTEDTTVVKDTIDRNPESFSAPH